MRLVIADAGPPHYLLLIETIGILEQLFGKVIIPTTVRNELANAGAPAVVREWIKQPPPWIEIMDSPNHYFDDGALETLDAGEKAAIQLAISLNADLILMDDREGVKIARNKGFIVTGTLGIIDRAAQRGILDMEIACTRLKNTNFRYPSNVMDALLKQHQGKPAKD